MIELDAPAIGFRAFKWKGGPLRSVGVYANWPVQHEAQHASCYYQTATGKAWATQFSNHEESAPVEKCACGIYAYSKPEPVEHLGSIRAVVIGYGRLIVHPDGWRAEKCEIIGLIPSATPTVKLPNCKHDHWDSLGDLCRDCGWTGQAIRSAGGTIPAPSRDALQILAEQYGTRVIENWEDGIALAQEQGATPIPDEVYAKATENLEAQLEGQFGGWQRVSLGEWPQVTYTTSTPLTITAANLNSESISTPPPPPTMKQRRTEYIERFKREKREHHAKHWRWGSKAA